MRIALAIVMLLFAAGSAVADPIYIDQLMESPLQSLQSLFPGLKREGCYRVAENRYVTITVDRKENKPWRIALGTAACRKSEDAALDIRHRKGVELGDSTVAVMEKMGRPDASAAPDAKVKHLGEIEYFYICRLSEGCARHTSIFIRDGVVSAISEWYSD